MATSFLLSDSLNLLRLRSAAAADGRSAKMRATLTDLTRLRVARCGIASQRQRRTGGAIRIPVAARRV